MDDTGGTFLRMARSRLVVHLPAQIRTCLEALNDDMVWWRANDQSNAIGNLVLHCAGSTRHYIGHVVGGHDFVRDRDAEFAERTQIPRADLLARLDVAMREADTVLSTYRCPSNVFDSRNDIPYLPRSQLVALHPFRCEAPHFIGNVNLASRLHDHPVSLGNFSMYDPYQRHDSEIVVEPGIDYQSLQRSTDIPIGTGDVVYEPFQERFHTLPRLGTDAYDIVGAAAQPARAG